MQCWPGGLAMPSGLMWRVAGTVCGCSSVHVMTGLSKGSGRKGNAAAMLMLQQQLWDQHASEAQFVMPVSNGFELLAE